MMRSSNIMPPLLIVTLSLVFSTRVFGQEDVLYSSIKYGPTFGRNCISFVKKKAPCDLIYGSLYAGEEKDWFQSSMGLGDRSVIKDLGLQTWSDKIDIPVVAALPRLAPGEQRNITIDTSGADGEPGRPGRPGKPGRDGASGSSETAISNSAIVGSDQKILYPPQTVLLPTPNVTRERRDGRPRVDPAFVKAILGHMYVIHVVNNNADFYALFRVDRLVRGDTCEVSWKLIDAPIGSATQ